ncbi:MAG: M12 family metallo-peptidase [Balneolales bacterium]|nr:M12 family metallo-peptidase [Balneolales bacterium]
MIRKSLSYLYLLVLSSLGLLITVQPVHAQVEHSNLFEFTSTPLLTAERDIQPVEYRAVRIDRQMMTQSLNTAPFQVSGRFIESAQIELPQPDGTFHRYHVVESPIMEEGLAAMFPEIKTYRIAGIDDPTASGRISITRAGFHAWIKSDRGTVYIDPFNARQPDYLMVYNRESFVASFQRTIGVSHQEPIVDDPSVELESLRALENENLQFNGTTLRTHRLAMAATAQYTSFHSQPNRCSTPENPVACAMSAIVVAMNRVNGLYERDISVTMVLIDNNEILISQNPGDYSNNSGVAMLNQNQARIDQLIGSANYDIGHVFSTGGGGVAQLGSVCNNAGKARGVTGLPQPINDPFYVDYVAHEIGHQYGATHTFNGSVGGCSGGNRSGNTAYEPGSGSTIMAYAGLCGAQNIQFGSDDYFHLASLIQMINFTNSGGGATCGTTSPTGNTPPVVEGGLTELTLPLQTPFKLTGSGSDADGDDLTFTWEQWDLGPAGAPNNPVGNAPLFRSFPPVEEPYRYFPRLSSVIGGSNVPGERLPDYQRQMRFRLTARDNAPGGGGIDFVQVNFSVTNQAGPFTVPMPGNGTQWQNGAEVLVAWNVANTNVAPVNAETVSILLSTNGGVSFDTSIAENIPNTGTAVVTVPSGINTTTARLKIKADNHIFFNVNPANFSISSAAAQPSASLPEGPVEFTVGSEEPTEGSISINAASGPAYNYFASISSDNLPEQFNPLPAENFSFSNPVGSVPGGASRDLDFTVVADNLSEGFYATRLSLTSDPGVDDLEVVLVFDVRVEGTFTRLLTPPGGWRLVSTPVEETTASVVFQNFTTQGFPGADDESTELNPNIYTYGNTGLRPISNIDTQIEGGNSVLAYLFPGDIPQFLRAIGFSNRSPMEIPLSNQTVIPDPGSGGLVATGWNFLGNPYSVNIDLNGLTDDDFVNAGRSIQIWNHRANNGIGGFLAWNGHDIYPDNVPSTQVFRGVLEPFQGFIVRASGINGSITLDLDALAQEGAGDTGDELFAAYYTLELTAGDFTTYTTVMFSDEGEAGDDLYDADQLIALSNDYAYFYSVAGNRARTINSLPLNSGPATVDVPLNVDATISGDFTIRLVKISGSAENFNNLSLTDTETGDAVTLGLGDSYTFSYEGTPADVDQEVKMLINTPGYRLPSTAPRFMATFDLRSPTSTGETHSELPQTVELRQNYPNPFNPTTNITFGLPEAADVRLDVFNVAGQRVATVVTGSMNSGYHTVTFDASRLASGVYLYRLEAGGQVRTEKMTLIK